MKRSRRKRRDFRLRFKIGQEVTYNHCLFEITGIDYKNKRYICGDLGHQITFQSQHIWKLESRTK